MHRSLVHSFHRFTTIPTAVTAMVQSPAVDVVAVGYEDGTIQIIDIRLGELVMKMRNDDGGVTALSFRMGKLRFDFSYSRADPCTDGPPVFATASTSGSIALWDLSKEGRLIHVQRMAHEQAVSALEWVSGQPLLISSSGDNSVKQWVFDSPTSVPRLLKFRSGHHAPPSCIRFFGEDGKQLLTSGKDRSLRYTSVVRDSRSHELSQGSIAKRAYANQVSADSLKASPIISMSSSSTRSKDWEDVLTAHAEDGVAKTWRVQDKRIGPWSFEVESGDVQAVCVTACGNFGLVGSSTGEIRMWNMQSGKDRRSFSLTGPAPGDTKASDTQRRPKKQVNGAGAKRSLQAITGLVADTLNTMVIASTLQGGLYFFDFHTTRLLHKLDLPTSVTSLTLQRDSGLLAAVCDDLAVRLVDIETKRVVRELRGFGGRILDIAFSADSRWILASSLDSVIRTFDIPTGQLVDAFRTRTLATSMAFSPTGDFLATAHVDSLGVHLWANRAQFTDIAVRHIKEEDDIPEIGLPSVQGLGENADIGDLEPIGAPEFTDVYTTPEQLEESLMTLSLLPRSRWQTLLNLETIRLRNKPKEPPKAPEKAPFFLPTVAGLETRFDVSTAPSTADADTHRLVPSSSMESPFTRRLTAAVEEGEHAEFFEYAKSLSPSALDLEIRSLSSLDHMAAFLETLTMRLRSHRDFEAVQALMSVFLTVHADVLIANAELKDSLVQLREEQRKESSRLSGLMGFAMGTLSFLRVSG